MLTPMTAPVKAPQVPPVRDIPPQKAEAARGKSSESTPCDSAIARTTLSAQKRPEENDCSALLRAFSAEFDFKIDSYELSSGFTNFILPNTTKVL
jgi:hypothetical protein